MCENGEDQPCGEPAVQCDTRPIPGDKSNLIIELASCVRASSVCKWVEVSIHGVNQYHTYRTLEDR